MSGPYVKAAFLCEQVIEGKDNVLSFVRVVDKVTQAAVGPDVPSEMPPFQHRLKLAIMLIAGDSLGRHDIRVDMRSPSGLSKPGPRLSVEFNRPTAGHNVIVDFQLQLEQEGPYWFEVFLDQDNEPLTRIPLEVSYQRMQTPPSMGLLP